MTGDSQNESSAKINLPAKMKKADNGGQKWARFCPILTVFHREHHPDFSLSSSLVVARSFKGWERRCGRWKGGRRILPHPLLIAFQLPRTMRLRSILLFCAPLLCLSCSCPGRPCTYPTCISTLCPSLNHILTVSQIPPEIPFLVTQPPPLHHRLQIIKNA